ncbi:hypothetical protein [Bradyrhizobium sp. Gha]|uniref:hypothetical protein n=1 Tax=Bradyrhizobium sp. Gha TaxID=1855318 RepID=UPI0008EEDAD8|nr:hypothetical protein [Bradyrhizobium sp. Gha]SFJ73064.1 hypothetical protein SAMN05216525_13374 [Bradyrhizobium sp. Gha]
MSLSSDPSGQFEEVEPEAVLFAMLSGNDRIACRVEWSALRELAIAGTDADEVAATFKRHGQGSS